MGGYSIIIHNKLIHSKAPNLILSGNFLKILQKTRLPVTYLLLIIIAIIVKKIGSNIAIVYHAECLSPIEAARYLSFLMITYTHSVSPVNSLKYDIAVIYCIFIGISDIRYRS